MEKKHSGWKKSAAKIVGLLVGLLIIWYMVKDIIHNWTDIVPYLINMNVPVFFLSIVLYGIAFLFTGYNWTYLLWKMEKGPGIRAYLNIHMVSALARYIPGGVWGIVGKAYLCNEKGVAKRSVTVNIILEYVFQIVSSGLFFVLLLPFLLKEGAGTYILILAVMAVILVILPWCINWGICILSKIMKSECGELKLKRGFVYRVLGRYMAAWGVTGIGLIVLVAAFSEINLLQGLYIALSYPVSWVVGFLSPSPNGMGIREGILRLLLGDRQAHEFVLLIVVTTRIWTILGEILAFLGFKLYYICTRGK